MNPSYILSRQHTLLRVVLVATCALLTWICTERSALALYRYCGTYSPSFLDSGVGETYLNVAPGASIPMSYHYYQFLDSQGQIVVSGYFDSAGCATATTATGQGQLRIWPLVKRSGVGGTSVIRAKLTDENEAMSYVLWNLNNAYSPNLAVTKVTKHNTIMADYFRATAVASALPGSLIPGGKDWTIVVQADTDQECQGIDACADDSTLFLGKDQNGSWYNQRKTVIAHELGHLAQNGLFGRWASEGNPVAGAVDYSDVASNALYCSCWYVFDAGNQSHCLSSREFLAPAFNEGWAHFFAARSLNDSTQSSAVFPYYKEAMIPFSSQPASCGQPQGTCYIWLTPVAHNVITGHRWLETQCAADAIPHRGTEMDWLGLLYNLNVSHSYSGTIFKSIMQNSAVCNGTCDGNDIVTWSELNQSVNTQGALTAAQRQKFNDQSITYGTRR